MATLVVFYLLFMILLALVTGDSLAFTLLYLMGGAFFLSRWWMERAVQSLQVERDFPRQAFPGDTLEVRVRVRNPGRLPLLWLRLRDYLPTGIPGSMFDTVTRLAPRQAQSFRYNLRARRRGYYPIGPLRCSSGDLLGLGDEKALELPVAYLTVFPSVIPLGELHLPSRAPLGILSHCLPIFEDPSRPIGKRAYRQGDSLRRIDWKATAATGKLQVRLFEPSIALDTAIFLDLNKTSYHYRSRADDCELAITAAASLAGWIIRHRQAAGLVTNGRDPLTEGGPPHPILPRKGRGQFQHLLGTLGRVEPVEQPDQALPELLREHAAHLGWGATLVIITGRADRALFEEFPRLQRAGLQITLILIGRATGEAEIRPYATRMGVRLLTLWNEQDLETLQVPL